MKIGILTVNRAINVGAVLQAYALQEILRKIGHDAWIINYLQPEVEKSNRPKYTLKGMIKLLLNGHLRSFYHYPSSQKKQKIKEDNFDNFLSNYLNCTPLCEDKSIPIDFDGYVIGSDQVWNRNIFQRQDPVFWGMFKKRDNAKLVSYAASTSIESLNQTDKSFIESALAHFSLISVREDPVADYMNRTYHLPLRVQANIDPTLAAPLEIWASFESDIVPKEPYIFVYAARAYKKNPKLVHEKAEDLGKKMHCKVVYMSYTRHSPVDYVALIKHAKAVVTSSFHGVAFSLIFNRQLFALLYGDEQDYRYKNLLESLGASDRLYHIETDITVHLQDYTIVNSNLGIKRAHAINFLKMI